MPLIATAPIRIGNRIRQPGEELHPDELAGRNVDSMKRHGHVAFVEHVESRKPAGSRSRKPAGSDE